MAIYTHEVNCTCNCYYRNAEQNFKFETLLSQKTFFNKKYKILVKNIVINNYSLLAECKPTVVVRNMKKTNCSLNWLFID